MAKLLRAIIGRKKKVVVMAGKRAWDVWQNAVSNNTCYELECRLRRKEDVETVAHGKLLLSLGFELWYR
jgi:hypothetical protein